MVKLSANKITTVIAEIGVNHNGNVQTAKELIDVAVRAKSDIVKFQMFNSDELTTERAGLAGYQQRNLKTRASQKEMLQAYEFNDKQWEELYKYAENYGIEFLVTAFDLNSLSSAIKLGCKRVKIASGELTNTPFLSQAGLYDLPTILSTGMANLEEIDWAVDTLYRSGLSKKNLTILHCTSNYPAEPHELNLSAIKTLSERYRAKVGYSDHSLGCDAAIGSVTLGASLIEKHITLSKNLPGPDHVASMEPKEFIDFVSRVKLMGQSLGNGIKEPTESEKVNRTVVRKSLVAKIDIKKGDYFTHENVTTMRPGDGISAMRYAELLGKKAKSSYTKNDAIKLTCIV